MKSKKIKKLLITIAALSLVTAVRSKNQKEAAKATPVTAYAAANSGGDLLRPTFSYAKTFVVPPLEAVATKTSAQKIDPVEAPRWKPTYSDTRLGRAWEASWSVVLGCGAKDPSAEIERKQARVTAFCNGDANSAQKKSSTGVPLRPATASQIGVAAGHPDDVGKYVTVSTDEGKRTYLIADTGSALVTREADRRGVGEVVDLYAPGGEDWSSYQDVTMVAVEGSDHFLLTPPSERRKFLSWDAYRRAVALAQRG